MLLKDVFARDPGLPLEPGVSLVDQAQFQVELGEYVLTSDAAHGARLLHLRGGSNHSMDIGRRGIRKIDAAEDTRVFTR